MDDSAQFERIISWMDAKQRMKKHKILLLVDKCPAHPEIKSMKFIKLVFLPPNTTPVLQPLDTGVINSLKMHFWKPGLSYQKHWTEGWNICLNFLGRGQQVRERVTAKALQKFIFIMLAL